MENFARKFRYLNNMLGSSDDDDYNLALVYLVSLLSDYNESPDEEIEKVGIALKETLEKIIPLRKEPVLNHILKNLNTKLLYKLKSDEQEKETLSFGFG